MTLKGATSKNTHEASPAWRGETVAVVLLWRGRVALFKRSRAVGSDQGRWHCITGHVDPGRTPLEQAVQEAHEETGLGVDALDLLEVGPVLDLPDRRGGSWLVHTLLVETQQKRLALNWEHDGYRWVRPGWVRRFEPRSRGYSRYST